MIRHGACCPVVAALIVALAAIAAPYALQRTFGVKMVWVAWLLPFPAVWEAVHLHAGKSVANGGIYPGQVDHSGYLGREPNRVRRSEYRQVESEKTPLEIHIARRYPDYGSVLDVGSGAGVLLARMCYLNNRCNWDNATNTTTPCARHYGLDIAPSMVTATRAMCRECTNVGTFDISRLQDQPFAPADPAFPRVFDLVVVSDLLYLVRWGWFPPAVHRYLPPEWFRRAHQTFWENLRRMAVKEVVFSDHQDNPHVDNFLMAMGAVERLAIKGVSGTKFWTVPGMGVAV